MERQDGKLMTHILTQAILKGHAVTLCRDGAIHTAEPYAVKQSEGKWCLAYFDVEGDRFRITPVDMFSEVVDLGKSLDDIQR